MRSRLGRKRRGPVQTMYFIEGGADCAQKKKPRRNAGKRSREREVTCSGVASSYRPKTSGRASRLLLLRKEMKTRNREWSEGTSF